MAEKEPMTVINNQL